jgi:hypothetical protein
MLDETNKHEIINSYTAKNLQCYRNNVTKHGLKSVASASPRRRLGVQALALRFGKMAALGA